MISIIFLPCLSYDGNSTYYVFDTIPLFFGYGSNPFMIFVVWIWFKVYVPASIWPSSHMVIHYFIWILFYPGKFMSASTTNSSYFRNFYNYLSTDIFSAKSIVSCLNLHVKLFFSICSEYLFLCSLLSAMATEHFKAKDIGLRAQKKILSRMSSKAAVKVFIDDRSASILDNTYRLFKQYVST